MMSRQGDNLTTSEIIVDRRPRSMINRCRDTDLVAVALPYTERVLREKLKAAGGRWDSEERVWRVCFGAIRGDTTLVERIATSRSTMRTGRVRTVYVEQVTYTGYWFLPWDKG